MYSKYVTNDIDILYGLSVNVLFGIEFYLLFEFGTGFNIYIFFHINKYNTVFFSWMVISDLDIMHIIMALKFDN